MAVCRLRGPASPPRGRVDTRRRPASNGTFHLMEAHPSDPLHAPGSPHPGVLPWWAGVALALLVGALLLGGTCVGGLLWLDTVVPETSVYPQNLLPSKYVVQLRDAGVIGSAEPVRFLYSDGVLSISEGSYLLTDRAVVVWGESFTPRLQRYPLADIEAVALTRDTSFFVDSDVRLTLRGGGSANFPLSSEHDRDVQFVDALRDAVEAEAAR